MAVEVKKPAGETKVAVIGGGPGGYVAAIRAAQLGGKVTLIEKNKLGGTCLNVGCIPTKAILHAAEALTEAKEMAEYGINIEVKNVDWKQVQAKKNAITAQLVGGVTGLMKANKIQIVEGTASFASKDTLAVLKKDGTKENMTFDKIIIAAGSVPAVPPIPGVKENANCVDSTGALSFEEIPKSLLVIGGGVIGIELATAYSKFGTEVTVVEAAPKLLPMMDGELTAQLRKLMEAKGVKIMTDAKVQSVEAAAVGAKVNVEIGGKVQPFEAEKVLVAVGRRTDTEALGLDAAGIANDRGRITVNDKMETNVPNVYAIGDCLGKVMLAHVASAQGEVAAENALHSVISSYNDGHPSDDTKDSYSRTYVECRAQNRDEYYSLNGGLLFIGLFLGAMFLMVTVLIIFYKQISEGYEDKERYAIMEKVGMSNDEVKKSITSQVRMVFFLPIILAACHLAAAFPLLRRLLVMFNLTDVKLIVVCMVATLLVFMVIYYIVFKITSRAYYRIVGNQI